MGQALCQVRVRYEQEYRASADSTHWCVALLSCEFQGCVPSNSEDGRMIRAGERVRDHDFVFSCEENDEDILSYEAIGEDFSVKARLL